MNKYELALVVSAKVEDEVRDAVVEKAKRIHHTLQRHYHRSRRMG